MLFSTLFLVLGDMVKYMYGAISIQYKIPKTLKQGQIALEISRKSINCWISNKTPFNPKFWKVLEETEMEQKFTVHNFWKFQYN